MAHLVVGFSTIFALIIAIILTISLIFVMIKCMFYLLCKKSLEIDSKKIFVNIITKSNKQKIKKRKLKISYEPFIRWGTLCSLTLYLIANIFSLSSLFILLLTSNIRILQRFAFYAWFIGRLCMHCVFVARLRFSFKNTKWMYNKHVFIMLYCLLSLFPIIISYWLIVTICTNGHIWKYPLLLQINSIVIILMILLNVFFPFILIVLFQRKLFQLIKSYFISIRNYTNSTMQQHENVALHIDIGDSLKDLDVTHSIVSMTKMSKTAHASHDHTDMDLNAHDGDFQKNTSFAIAFEHPEVTIDGIFDVSCDVDRKYNTKMRKYDKIYNDTKLAYINTITQYTILICFSVVTSVAVCLYVLMKRNAAKHMDEADELHHLFYFEFILHIDAVINSYCLYLQFPFGLKFYKFMCANKFCLHGLCVSVYGKYVDRVTCT